MNAMTPATGADRGPGRSTGAVAGRPVPCTRPATGTLPAAGCYRASVCGVMRSS